MFVYMGWLTVRYLFGRNRFEATWWAYSFPFDAMALIWSAYHAVVPGTTTLVFVYTFMAMACGINAYLGAITIAELARRQLFIPEIKSGAKIFDCIADCKNSLFFTGPFRFMKSIHESLRFSMDKLLEVPLDALG